MDIDGYVNPRSLGNQEPQRFLHMDIFFEQELWDKYIANKDTSRRDLYTWEATALAALKGLSQLRGRGLTGQAADEALLKGVKVSGKIGHHKPCKLRVYQHPDIVALCVGLCQ